MNGRFQIAAWLTHKTRVLAHRTAATLAHDDTLPPRSEATTPHPKRQRLDRAKHSDEAVVDSEASDDATEPSQLPPVSAVNVPRTGWKCPGIIPDVFYAAHGDLVQAFAKYYVGTYRVNVVRDVRTDSLVSASLLTIVVVASVAAVGWVRKRQAALSADGSKKKDEDAVETPVEIVVDEAKKSSTDARGSTTSLTTELMNFRLPPELVNRRQYVKAICDRFESLANKAMENSSLRDGCLAKNKLNNLSSFVRQCVSNIERSQLAPPVIPNHMVPSSRASVVSNQSDAANQQQLKREQRVPSLVVDTDVEVKGEDPADDEPTVVKRPLLTRQPSTTDNNRATLKRSLDCDTAAATPLPPVSRPKSARANRGIDLPAPPQPTEEPPSNQTSVTSPASQEKAQDAEPETPVEPRKSLLTGKLQQFQQLVPSNQARSTMQRR
ncbi:hypothetical protein P43SY_001335 [Pythium insidiosum]|uniref:Transmembrane protein n=1 Tax=Pythium insidiosum TaxID=114742 RepID=A0AAD5Q9K1_PYTIN|nr:hypothetical protein P43SY_001335 [Pythium insidiosum]